MPTIPPTDFIEELENHLIELLEDNPLATSSEAYVQNYLEFSLIRRAVTPPYFLRIGINYHGNKVQHIVHDPASGALTGWNPDGDALGTAANANVLLAGHTIFDRLPDEQLMSDTKVGGGAIPPGHFVRVEFKVRGWLGKTKNLDGKQLQKDIDLLGNDRADLLVWCLSETAHRKWRGEGPEHQSERRTGCSDFRPLLKPVSEITTSPNEFSLNYRRLETAGDYQAAAIWHTRQTWRVRNRVVFGAPGSLMPGASHYLTFCWRT